MTNHEQSLTETFDEHFDSIVEAGLAGDPVREIPASDKEKPTRGQIIGRVAAATMAGLVAGAGGTVVLTEIADRTLAPRETLACAPAGNPNSMADYKKALSEIDKTVPLGKIGETQDAANFALTAPVPGAHNEYCAVVTAASHEVRIVGR